MHLHLCSFLYVSMKGKLTESSCLSLCSPLWAKWQPHTPGFESEEPNFAHPMYSLNVLKADFSWLLIFTCICLCIGALILHGANTHSGNSAFTAQFFFKEILLSQDILMHTISITPLQYNNFKITLYNTVHRRSTGLLPLAIQHRCMHLLAPILHEDG